MNILIVVDKFFERSETFIYKHIQALEEHNIILVGRRQENRPSFPLSRNVKALVIYKSFLWRLSYKLFSKNLKYDFVTNQILTRIVRKHHIDIVLAHYGPIALRTLNAIDSVPVIGFFHGYDLSRKLSDEEYTSRLKRAANSFHYCVTPSRYLGEILLKKFGLQDDKLKVIPYGIDLEKIDIIKPKELDKEEKITLLHAGRVIPKKGLQDLVTVFSELIALYQIELIIIGDGWDMEKLKDKIQELGIGGSIKLLGEQPHEVVISYMKSADIFVLNSQIDHKKETEGFPNTIIEAMYCGCPVVSTFHAGIPEAIQNGKTGLLVPEKDNSQLKDALMKMIEDAGFRKMIAENAYEYSKGHFAIEKMNSSISAILN